MPSHSDNYNDVLDKEGDELADPKEYEKKLARTLELMAQRKVNRRIESSTKPEAE